MAADEFAEVIGAPYSAWIGPVGTPAPAIDALEAVFDPGWFKLGTNGINNQGAKGVVTNIGRTVSDFVPAGGTLPVKSWVTEEKITVGFSVVDLSVEQFAAILDEAVITTVTAATGRAAQKSISLIRGVNVHYYALLLRGISPYDNSTGLNAQYEFARVYQSAAQAPTYLKGTPAELDCEFTVSGAINLTDPATYRAETAPHT